MHLTKTLLVLSLSQDEVKELNRLLGKVIHAFDETKEKDLTFVMTIKVMFRIY